MNDFIIVNARIITLDEDDLPRRGAAMGNLGIIEHGYLVVRNGLIDRLNREIQTMSLLPTMKTSPSLMHTVEC